MSAIHFQSSTPQAAGSIGITSLLDELILEIFQKLPPMTLAAQIPFVCKNFKRLAADHSLYQAYAKVVKIFGKAEYEAFADKSLGLNFDGLPPIDRRAAVILARDFFANLAKEGLEIEGRPPEEMLISNPKLREFGNYGLPFYDSERPSYEEIEDDVELMVLDIPANLSDAKLFEIAAKNGHAISFTTFKKAFGIVGICIQRPYRILIPSNVIKGSRGLSYEKREVLPGRIGCESASATEILALLVATYLTSPDLETTLRKEKALYARFAYLQFDNARGAPIVKKLNSSPQESAAPVTTQAATTEVFLCMF